MTRSGPRRAPAAGAATLAAAALLLAACSTSGPSPGAGARSEPATAPTARRGGYYLDDGPGATPPPDIEAIPDAVPRAEPLLARANRPYTVFDRRYVPMTELAPYRERGLGSWYGRRYHGQRTSSGEVYDMYAMTAAHPTLPLPSYARVTNVRTGRSVVVRVNDRGPFLYDRIIDLSYTAAAKLGYVNSGSAELEVELITRFDAPADAAIAASGTGPAAATARSGTGATVAVVGPGGGAAPRESLTVDTVVAGGAQPAAVRPVPATGAGASSSGLAPMPVPAASPAGASAAAPATGRGDRLEVETLVAPAAGPAPAPAAVAAPAAAAVTAASTKAAPAIAPAAPARPPGDAAAGGGLYLQLAAFATRENAESSRMRLARELEWLADRLLVRQEGGLFKVHAGPYRLRDEALAAADRIRQATAFRPFPVAR